MRSSLTAAEDCHSCVDSQHSHTPEDCTIITTVVSTDTHTLDPKRDADVTRVTSNHVSLDLGSLVSFVPL